MENIGPVSEDRVRHIRINVVNFVYTTPPFSGKIGGLGKEQKTVVFHTKR